MAVSVFDIFKIGIGPSSSHTMGPWKAARAFLERLRDRGRLTDVHRVEVILYGSLAKTGPGHGTRKAIQMGLLGEDPEHIDPASLPVLLADILASKQLCLLGLHGVPFDPGVHVIYSQDEVPLDHPNTLRIRAQMKDETWIEEVYYSVGGGFIVREGETPDETASALSPPYPAMTGAELLSHCRRTGRSISELVRHNELTWRDDDAINTRLDQIWTTMRACAYRGCHAEGELPGGLGVRRRASRLNRRLLERNPTVSQAETLDNWIEAIQSVSFSFQDTLRWISCFALAVNEENATFGRVVTAPTNGAAGVIPAIMLYQVCFGGATDEDLRRFLLTAGQVGLLFKHGATISAAMGGCQAEIGVSSAMAAAGLAECLGGSPEQALMAAEIAMEHHLGLTCDPVGGLVQIPCIERNSMGAVKAATAASVALEGDPGEAKVSLDTIIETMWMTAQDMHSKYKETSEGGLAVQIPVNVIEC